ncbi:unnamed protein product [Staurois parvus]|uniref:Uncharacterized protein n=1 Tax=Staurois parvus TaxID=386267 RepID=A0ABN9FUJ5_9NEOB|nr:unnamed protein product [Staurois parvus]
MWPPTDPGPSGSARVSKWSVRPWGHPYIPNTLPSPYQYRNVTCYNCLPQ